MVSTRARPVAYSVRNAECVFVVLVLVGARGVFLDRTNPEASEFRKFVVSLSLRLFWTESRMLVTKKDCAILTPFHKSVKSFSVNQSGLRPELLSTSQACLFNSQELTIVSVKNHCVTPF